MKTGADKSSSRKNGYQSDDENIKYKLNIDYFNKLNNKSTVTNKKQEKIKNEDDDIRYKFPTVLNKPKIEQKPKPKPKIKVNFWSNKQAGSRFRNNEINRDKVNRRHTVAAVTEDSNKPKNSAVKVRKRVSFLPSPLFSDNHVPMVTVPDDLTIHLNEEEANDLGEDLNSAFVNSDSSGNDKNEFSKRKAKSSTTQTSPKSTKRKRNSEELDSRSHGNENELEFFSKYVVQKLRKMETNQRIYSENLINTVLMLGQLGKLNGKSRISET
ncbi:unnamed protein product [Diatraea saccharalis]|uniref:Uncharacterized protein n=1 Tax=Diatraea saccharalis TaxID=40085 RepID=A0A9N9QWX6_9NEOP|nr:unnamed protein product [Diatraea saccharalis]